MLSIWDPNHVIKRLNYFFMSPYEMINCTIGIIPGAMNIGHKLSNGSYDGSIGILQREAANATALAYVLGSTDDEPVIVGPVMSSTEMSILSVDRDPGQFVQGPEGWLDNFSPIVYTYHAICLSVFCYIFVIFSSLSKFMRRKKLINQKFINYSRRINFNRDYVKIFSNCTLALIYAVKFDTLYSTTKCLIFFYTIAISVAINGYFLGLTSTDMIAIRPLPSVETLSDLLYNEYFMDTNVSAPGGLWHEQVLRGAIASSPEGQLWRRVSDLLPIQFAKSAQMAGKFMNRRDEIFNQKSVLVVDKIAMDIVVSITCQGVGVEKGRKMRVSKDTFGEKLMVFSVSKQSDKVLINWINYRQSRLLQSGLMDQWTRSAGFDIKIDPNFKFTSIVTCLTGNNGHDEQTAPEAIEVTYLAPWFRSMFILQLISGFILILEMFLSQIIQLLL